MNRLEKLKDLLFKINDIKEKQTGYYKSVAISNLLEMKIEELENLSKDSQTECIIVINGDETELVKTDSKQIKIDVLTEELKMFKKAYADKVQDITENDRKGHEIIARKDAELIRINKLLNSRCEQTDDLQQVIDEMKVKLQYEIDIHKLQVQRLEEHHSDEMELVNNNVDHWNGKYERLLVEYNKSTQKNVYFKSEKEKLEGVIKNRNAEIKKLEKTFEGLMKFVDTDKMNNFVSDIFRNLSEAFKVTDNG